MMLVTMTRGPGVMPATDMGLCHQGQGRGAVHQLLQHLRRGHGESPPLGGGPLLALDTLSVGVSEDRGQETGAE